MEICTYSKANSFTIPMLYQEQIGLKTIGPLQTSFCFILVENGNGIVRINDNKIIFIAPIIFYLDENDSIFFDEKLNETAKIIYFKPSILNDIFNFGNIRNIPDDFSVTAIQDAFLLRPFLEENDKIRVKTNLDSHIVKRFTYLCEQLESVATIQNDKNWSCRSRSYLMEILFLLDNIQSEFDVKKDTIITEDEEKISSILLFLKNNYYNKITINQLTKQFTLNRTSLSDNFNKIVGESIITYLNKLRIKIASTMLRDTRLPISEIMIRVGFNENTHFLRTFKKYMGMSPREYRDKFCIL